MNRHRFYAEIETLVNSLAGLYNAGEFCSEAQGRGVPAMPVNSVAELLSDPHLEATGFWDEVELGDGKRIRWPGPPFRIAGLAPPRRPPGIGEQFASAHHA